MNWLRERIAGGEIKMLYEPGLTQRADLGTKALPKERLKQLVELWGFRDYNAETKILAKFKNDEVTSATASTTRPTDILDRKAGHDLPSLRGQGPRDDRR